MTLSHRLRISLLSFVVCLTANSSFAQLGSETAIDDQEPFGALRDLDVRFAGDQPADFVLEALRAARTTEARKARAAEYKQLTQRLPHLRLDDHVLFGTPKFLRSTSSLLSEPLEPGTWTIENVVEQYLTEHRALFEVDPLDLGNGRVSRSYISKSSGAVHWTLLQQHRGLDVFECELRANLTRAGELINLSSSFLPTPRDGFRVSEFRMSPGAALEAALASVGAPAADFVVTGDASWPQFAEWSAENWTGVVTSERVYFPLTRLELRAAYSIDLGGIGGLNNYRVLVDAESGATLWRWNAILHVGGNEDATFRAFTTDSPRPMSPGLQTVGSTIPPLVSRQLVTVTGASVAAASPMGWIDDGDNTTAGNNCIAHSDLLGTNSPNPRPVGSPYRVFDQPMDLTQDLSAYTAASIINLFYWGNLYHDRLYAAGFDEASGNFQEQNFGNGGAGNDPMVLEGQDGGDMNNARYFHSGEGTSARIEMYPFTFTNPFLDGGLDSDIVYHELAHGTSLRLVGNLNAHQSAGMGEGWGDFVGMSLNGEAGDDLTATFAAGPYATQSLGGLSSSYYFGIRRFPYSTDLQRSPMTFADIDPAQFGFSGGIPVSPIANLGIPDEIHNVGEIWCAALWECRANMIAAHGFAGNDMMLELVVEGMKLTPGAPDFLEARDGILQADLVLNQSSNFGSLWSGFAKRGMGVSANAPPANSVSGVSEAFDVPPGVIFIYPNGLPEQVLPGQLLTIDVETVGASQPLPGTGMLNFRVNGGGFVSVPMAEMLPGEYVAAFPAFTCFDLVEYFVSADDASTTYTGPPNAPTDLHAFQVYESTQDVLVDDFEVDMGWTVTSNAGDGDWERGIPADNDRGDPPADFDGSGICFLTDNNPSTSNSDVDNGSTSLISPAMDLASGATISYAYWFNDDANGPLSAGDTLDVDVATNAAGTNWVQLRSYTTASANWRTDQILIGVEVSPSSTIRVRFTASDINSQNVVEAGIDAFSAGSIECTGTGVEYCYGDGSGNTCPCGNTVPLGTPAGCLNSAGSGARIVATGTPSVQNDTLHFDLIAAPPGSFALLVSGDNQLNGGTGILAFDGLRCMGGNFKRHGGRSVDGSGQANNGWGPPANPAQGLVAQGQFVAGQTRNFQVLYRDSPLEICGLGQNSSTAFSVTFQP